MGCGKFSGDTPAMNVPVSAHVILIVRRNGNEFNNLNMFIFIKSERVNNEQCNATPSNGNLSCKYRKMDYIGKWSGSKVVIVRMAHLTTRQKQ